MKISYLKKLSIINRPRNRSSSSHYHALQFRIEQHVSNNNCKIYRMIEMPREHSYTMSDRKTATVSTVHFISVTPSTDPE